MSIKQRSIQSISTDKEVNNSDLITFYLIINNLGATDE